MDNTAIGVESFLSIPHKTFEERGVVVEYVKFGDIDVPQYRPMTKEELADRDAKKAIKDNGSEPIMNTKTYWRPIDTVPLNEWVLVAHIQESEPYDLIGVSRSFYRRKDNERSFFVITEEGENPRWLRITHWASMPFVMEK